MRIINITAHIIDAFDIEDDNRYVNRFRLECAGVVLVEEEAPYGSDGDDLEQWAAKKLKGLFK